MAPLSRMGRPTDLQDNIVQGLRGLIVGGDLPPGSRLPTRSRLQDEYGASTNTVQRALERLKRDGFITTDGRNGTFVSEVPPHLTRYGLIFPHSTTDRAWSRFFSALALEAEHLQKADELSIPIFHGIETHTAEAEVRDFWRQVNEHLLAGLIIAARLEQFAETPLWNEPGIPRVLIGSKSVTDDKVPLVELDSRDWRAKAMAYLKQQGRHRPAFVWYRRDEEYIFKEERLWAEAGFEVRPEWGQITQFASPLAARRVTNLLFRAEVKPDALLLMDDNLVESAVHGLVDAGVRVPEDVEVIAHCNFPLLPPTALPVRNLGFDCRQVMRTCLDLIDNQRRGHPVPPMTVLPAFFENELPAR